MTHWIGYNPVLAQPYRLGDILYSKFSQRDDGILVSSFSVIRSSIVGYGVAFDCVQMKVNVFAPSSGLEVVDRKWRWTGWEDEHASEHSRMFMLQCGKYYK